MTLAPRQIANAAAGALILGLVTYCGYGYATAQTRVRALCAEIKPGLPIASVRSFASSHGLRKPSQPSGINYLVETRTFGRSGCRVTFEDGIVKTSVYSFAD